MPQYPAVLALASLDGLNGFTIVGADLHDISGRSVAGAGDVNGDGFADVLVGSYCADPHGLSSGAAYVVFGTASGPGAVIDLSNLDGTNGFRLAGEREYDSAGRWVSSAGDVNGDGISDMLIGAYGADTNGSFAGRVYVVFGTASGFDATLELSELDGANGFTLEGEAAFDRAGYSAAAAGDINGDGFGDILVGTSSIDPSAASPGAAYLVFGRATGFDAHIGLSGLDGANGVRLEGTDPSQGAGFSVSAAGDFNGDGIGDFIVGDQSPTAAHDGCAHIVFGKTTGFDAQMNLDDLDGLDGFSIVSAAPDDLLGHSVAALGDINSDGFDDIAIGAPNTNPHGIHSGVSYVVFGTSASQAASFSVSALDGANGFMLRGEHAYDVAGWSIASAGDFNGDGFADIIVAAADSDPSGEGSGGAYLVFGKGRGFRTNLDLSGLDGDNGFRIDGVAAGDRAGCSVSAAGDLNGDGFDDIIIGAPYAGVDDTGASYVIYGAMPTGAVTRTGTLIANTIHGGDSGDTLSGLDGNDTLIGHGGGDKLSGGQGKDALEGGAGNDSVFGGSGIDAIGGGDGNDNLYGGKGNDTLDGSLGYDVLNAGPGANRFVFEGAADSTGVFCDKITKASFAADVWDIPATVTAIDAAISTGTLRKAFFDADLSAAASGAHLSAHHAVLFTPDHGTLAGDVFLIVDLNGIGGYQAGEDLVCTLANAQNLTSLGVEDFI